MTIELTNASERITAFSGATVEEAANLTHSLWPASAQSEQPPVVSAFTSTGHEASPTELNIGPATDAFTYYAVISQVLGYNGPCYAISASDGEAVFVRKDHVLRVRVLAAGGDDVIDFRLFGRPVTILGGEGDDVLYSGSSRAVLLGEGGSDVMRARRATSILDGGDGYDIATGSTESDFSDVEILKYLN